MLSPDKTTRLVLSLPCYAWIAYHYGIGLSICILIIYLAHRIGEL